MSLGTWLLVLGLLMTVETSGIVSGQSNTPNLEDLVFAAADYLIPYYPLDMWKVVIKLS